MKLALMVFLSCLDNTDEIRRQFKSRLLTVLSHSSYVRCLMVDKVVMPGGGG